MLQLGRILVHSTLRSLTIACSLMHYSGASYDNNSPKDIEDDADSVISDQITTSLRITKPNKRYEGWKGSNKFWCKGGLMSGVHTSHLSTSCLLLFLTSFAYIVGISPLLQSVNSIYVELALYLINMTTLLLTSFTDPGIIPRYHASSMLSEVYSELKNTEVNFCNICHVFRPSRAKHCRHCDVCIDVFDHHCPWTGTCIGIRNYKYFLAFVFTVLLNTMYCLVSVVYLVIGWSFGMKTDQYVLRLAVVVVMGVWLLIIMSLLTILFIFHINLILRKQTTLGMTPTTLAHSLTYLLTYSRIEYLRQVPLPDRIKIEYNKMSVPYCMLYSLFPICYPGNQCNNGYITHGPTTRLLPMWQDEDPVSDALHDLEQMNQIKTDFCK